MFVNNNKTIHSLHELKVLKAIELYTNESPMLIKKCIHLAGFNKSDLQECGSLYTHFFGMALEYDFERLELLKNSKRNEMKSYLSSKSITTIDANCELEKIRKALTRYKFESCLTMVKCMIKAGFQSSETDMHDSNYLLCFENAVQAETMRWRYLRSNFRKARKMMIEKNKR